MGSHYKVFKENRTLNSIKVYHKDDKQVIILFIKFSHIFYITTTS